MHRSIRAVLIKLAVALSALLMIAQPAEARQAFDYDFTGPVFGMSAAKGGGLLVADAGSGVVRLRHGDGSLIAALPGVADVAAISRSRMQAVTGGPDSMLYRIIDGKVRPISDIGAFEAAVNPDGGAIDSNAFGVAALSSQRALVADAAANALLIVRGDGTTDWVATLPMQVVPTRNAKRIAGCPKPPPDLADICELPKRIPAEPVLTSVTVGPDGAWYVGELKGFPAPLNRSKVWRIEPGTRHAHCGSDPRCSVVLNGFTSIVDLSFDRQGMLNVVEFDEASFLAVETDQPTGGTVDSCDVATGVCSVLAGDLLMPTAVATTGGHTYATVMSLIPGQAKVIRIS
jgi:hypothetical protein